MFLIRRRSVETLRRYTSGLSEKSTARLAQLALAVVIGSFACIALLLWFAAMAPGVQAAPPARPLAEIITGTDYVTHTPSTTHQMRVFADGRISNQFFDYNPRNQIDQDGGDPYATMIAILFDQHSSDNVDVGAQGEFSPTTPITLNTASSIPGYSEDSYVVYASRVLSYQVTQRTLATTTNNCVIMELVINNTGSVTLTGGKLLYMVDIDVANMQTVIWASTTLLGAWFTKLTLITLPPFPGLLWVFLYYKEIGEDTAFRGMAIPPWILT
jgi:hypothetical protein